MGTKVPKKRSVVFLQDGEVVIRPVSEIDAEIFQIWVNDPQVREYVGQYLPQMLSDEKDWIERLKKDRANIVFVVEVSGRPIGTMGIHQIDLKNGVATTGAMFGEKEYWGKKYGRRAKALILAYAFGELRLNKINSHVIAYNERSVRYSLACGYKEEGRIRQQYFRKSKFWDLVWLGITREDWVEFTKKGT